MKWCYFISIVLSYSLFCLLVTYEKGIAVMYLILGIPIMMCLTHSLYVKRHNFSLLLLITTFVAWLPMIYIFNDSIFIYAIIYTVVSLMSQVVTLLIKRYV